ncbi:hypothetical protein OHD26_10735 [Escherichia coli]|nr:hypothetical protein [Escherichia coli]
MTDINDVIKTIDELIDMLIDAVCHRQRGVVLTAHYRFSVREKYKGDNAFVVFRFRCSWYGELE